MNTLLIVAALLIGNLAENPSFEAVDEQGVPLEWRGGYNAKVISLDADKPFHGQVCMRFALDGKETMLGQGGYFKLIPGKTYTFSTYVRANHDIAALQIQLINLGWSWSTPSRLALTNTQGKWQRFERTFVVPAPEAHPYQGRPNDDYQIVVYAKGVSGDVWIDALQLEEGDKATAFKGLDTHDPIAAGAKLLYDFAWTLFGDMVFNIILTPDYDDCTSKGHDNHFHVDLTPGSEYISGPGTCP